MVNLRGRTTPERLPISAGWRASGAKKNSFNAGASTDSKTCLLAWGVVWLGARKRGLPLGRPPNMDRSLQGNSTLAPLLHDSEECVSGFNGKGDAASIGRLQRLPLGLG